jgi:hypothetical protein
VLSPSEEVSAADQIATRGLSSRPDADAEQRPARCACLLLAIERGEKHGIWGGLIPRDLAVLGKEPERLEPLLPTFRVDPDDPAEPDLSETSP